MVSLQFPVWPVIHSMQAIMQMITCVPVLASVAEDECADLRCMLSSQERRTKELNDEWRAHREKAQALETTVLKAENQLREIRLALNSAEEESANLRVSSCNTISASQALSCFRYTISVY